MTSSTFVAIPPFSHREDSYQNKRMHNVGKASRPVERSAGKGTYMDRLFQATHQTQKVEPIQRKALVKNIKDLLRQGFAISQVKKVTFDVLDKKEILEIERKLERSSINDSDFTLKQARKKFKRRGPGSVSSPGRVQSSGKDDSLRKTGWDIFLNATASNDEIESIYPTQTSINTNNLANTDSLSLELDRNRSIYVASPSRPSLMQRNNSLYLEDMHLAGTNDSASNLFSQTDFNWGE